MTTVYLVRGSTGEYDDYSEWIAAAFLAESEADLFVKQIETEIARIPVDLSNAHPAARRELARQLQAIDPSCQVDYTGVTYQVIPIEILDGVPALTLDISRIREAADDK